MLIGELAERTGSSTRALRHYEDQGLLAPTRDTNGYRHYDTTDATRVAQIKAMIAAGMNTQTISRFLDCTRNQDQNIILEMCPDLRAELDAIAERLEAQQQRLTQTRQQLSSLSGACL